jgi:hypothetical protein
MARFETGQVFAQPKIQTFRGSEPRVLKELMIAFVSDNYSLAVIAKDFVLSVWINGDCEIGG